MATVCVVESAHAIARTPRDRLRISGNLERVLRLSDAFGETYDTLMECAAVVAQADEAVLWIARTGSPWRDLPALFGHWNTVFKRYRDWVKADVFKRLFDAASDEPDMEYAMVDATIVKVHRHGQGAKGGLRARPSVVPRAA